MDACAGYSVWRESGMRDNAQGVFFASASVAFVPRVDSKTGIPRNHVVLKHAQGIELDPDKK